GTDAIRDALAYVASEAGRMRRPDADVLVHVEHDDLRPVDRARHQLVEEPQLRVAGGEHGVRHTSLRHRSLQHPGGVVGGSNAELARGWEDPHPQPVDPAVAAHRVGLACRAVAAPTLLY